MSTSKREKARAKRERAKVDVAASKERKRGRKHEAQAGQIGRAGPDNGVSKPFKTL